MLDDNLPSFVIKPSSDNDLLSTVLLGRAGTFEPEYILQRPDPKLPASKNCYAIALCDSYNTEVLYAEVLVRPEWTQPTLSQAEIRAQNGIPPPPVPIVPESFIIQLYNPDQQVTVKQIAGSWNSSAYWEFEMPQQTFRLPSASALDRSQDDPAVSHTTPKVTFKWKKDGKLSRDITCYMVGKSTDGKKSKEPDITVAMYKHSKELTIYEPNMHRVDVEDSKGLEVVILLSATVVKDIFFNANREIFNISETPPITVRKNGNGPITIGTSRITPPVASSVLEAPSSTSVSASRIPGGLKPRPHATSTPNPRPPPTDPRIQWDIDAETARLRALVEAEEKERERAERHEQRHIKKMLEAEEKERQRQEAEVAKETERLRRQYGVQSTHEDAPRVHFKPPLPARPGSSSRPNSQQPFPQYLSAPHSRLQPFERPQSTPAHGATSSGPFNAGTWGVHRTAGSSQTMPRPYESLGPATVPYQQMPGHGTASSSGVFGAGRADDRHRLLGLPIGGKKIQKKRSVFF
ncbi:MAG: hypothetical protein M1818_001715 [Claussenomyces sp. TS43310]|nr:MAG: hypothetical protein M1818_001715 [Claussenomyces sp. TS43310]